MSVAIHSNLLMDLIMLRKTTRFYSLIPAALIAAGLLSAEAASAAPTFNYRHVIVGLVPAPTPAQVQKAAEIVMALTGGPALPAGEVSWPYSYDLNQLLTVTGDTAYDKTKVTWEVQSGQLPPGLSLGADGVISGTPTTKDLVGSSFQVLATYKTKTGQQAYTIVVNGAVLHVTQVSTGGTHSCAITTAGGLKCWGDNQFGQLGDGTKTSRSKPVDVTYLTSLVDSVSAGPSHTCAVTKAGGAYCWGNNGSYQLGDGTSTARLTAIGVSGLGTGVASISAGNSNTCVVTTGGGAKCWGYNYYGQVGDGSKTTRPSPANVSGLTTGVRSIVASPYYYYVCAVTTDGAAKCWGNNGYGQLGTGGTTDATTPANVVGLSSGVASLALGYGHGCALLSNETVQCWGHNTYGQVGNGNTTIQYSPVSVSGLSGVTSLTAGQHHACAAVSGGGAKCWGYNAFGQLGDNSTANRSVPVQVSGLTSGVMALTGGTGHTCAITGAGPMCWGNNTTGQLGNNSTTASKVPVNVVP